MSDQSPIDTTASVRHDGWTRERRVKFLDHLAATGNVRAACARAGKSAEAAYRLKRREPAFARAWAAALALACEAGEEVLATRAIDGVEEDVWYRGELVGTRRKYDSRLLLAHLARLDRLAGKSPARDDRGRFDELVALAVGAEVPELLLSVEGEPLPPSRETVIRCASREAEEEFYAESEAADADETGDEADEVLTREEREESRERFHEALEAYCEEAEEAASALWDGWRSEALALVDGLRGSDGDGEGDGDGDGEGASPFPCTPSPSSTSGVLPGLPGYDPAGPEARA